VLWQPADVDLHGLGVADPPNPLGREHVDHPRREAAVRITDTFRCLASAIQLLLLEHDLRVAAQVGAVDPGVHRGPGDLEVEVVRCRVLDRRMTDHGLRCAAPGHFASIRVASMLAVQGRCARSVSPDVAVLIATERGIALVASVGNGLDAGCLTARSCSDRAAGASRARLRWRSQVHSAAAQNAAPYYFNLEVSRDAVDAGVHCADLGGNTEIVFQQKELDAEAKQRNVSVIPDCGSPGMATCSRPRGFAGRDAEPVKIYVGGLATGTPSPRSTTRSVYSLEGALRLLHDAVLGACATASRRA